MIFVTDWVAGDHEILSITNGVTYGRIENEQTDDISHSSSGIGCYTCEVFAEESQASSTVFVWNICAFNLKTGALEMVKGKGGMVGWKK